MAHYLVRANLREDTASELRENIGKHAFLKLQPFGSSLTRALNGLRHDPQTNHVFWEEEDYCSPPLEMERHAVLDRYFYDIRMEQLSEGEGWARIAKLPTMWK